MAPRFLWLLRHAKTVADPPKGGADFDRVLAPRGRRDATALGALMGRDGTRLGLVDIPLPQVVLVSPAARAVATADLALAELAAPPDRHLVPDLYGAEPEEVLEHLRTLPDELRSVMVVGHNPTAQALSLGLIGRFDKKGHDLAVRRGFPTCALGVYTFKIDSWSAVASGTARLAGLFIPPFALP
ncbi:MAG TPA: histidine phosphatase family protein [Acidimicrobiales bacterium]|nr:histidine phosphatase family protein [Acidimicrobiales bacterium]